METIIKKLKFEKGQTLLEMIIAAGIIIASVITIISLSIVTIRGGRASEYRVIAANLAREGIEYFRNIRDTNWLVEDNSWDTDLDEGAYIIEFNGTDWKKSVSTDINTCSGDQSCNLKIVVAEVPNKGIYCHNTSSFCVTDASSLRNTQFYRLITIEDTLISVTSGTTYTTKNIRSQVRWTEKGKSHDVILGETLTPWR
jgi:Tfp pilus assembly protein PilV